MEVEGVTGALWGAATSEEAGTSGGYEQRAQGGAKERQRRPRGQRRGGEQGETLLGTENLEKT